jgi:hypothetical protein
VATDEVTPAAWLLLKNLNPSGNIYYGAQAEVEQGQGMPLAASGEDLLPPLGGSLYIDLHLVYVKADKAGAQVWFVYGRT